MTVSSIKELMLELNSNIDMGTNNFYEYEEYSFYRDGEMKYKVFDSEGNDVGSFDIDEIESSFIKPVLKRSKSKSSFGMKRTQIKKKPRRKKVGDMIIPEFMEWLHTKNCIVNGCNNTNIEAHHVLGRQPKRYDNLCVPLCSEHHRGSVYSWHEGNVKMFRSDYSKEKLSSIATKLFTEWINNEFVPDKYNIDKFRYVSDKIIDRRDPIELSIREAILEFEDHGE